MGWFVDLGSLSLQPQYWPRGLKKAINFAIIKAFYQKIFRKNGVVVIVCKIHTLHHITVLFGALPFETTILRIPNLFYSNFITSIFHLKILFW